MGSGLATMNPFTGARHAGRFRRVRYRDFPAIPGISRGGVNLGVMKHQAGAMF